MSALSNIASARPYRSKTARSEVRRHAKRLIRYGFPERAKEWLDRIRDW